jgi:hypothetical protein
MMCKKAFSSELILFFSFLCSAIAWGQGSRVFDVPQMGQVQLENDRYLRVGISLAPYSTQKVLDSRGQLVTQARVNDAIVRTLRTNLSKSERFAVGPFVIEWSPERWSAATKRYSANMAIYRVGASDLVGELLATQKISGILRASSKLGMFDLVTKNSGHVSDKNQFPLLVWKVQSPARSKFKPIANIAKRKK